MPTKPKPALPLTSPEKHHRVLDVGCGTGNFSLKLAGYGCEVTGIDLSEEMLAQARHKAEGIKPEILLKGWTCITSNSRTITLTGCFP